MSLTETQHVMSKGATEKSCPFLNMTLKLLERKYEVNPLNKLKYDKNVEKKILELGIFLTRRPDNFLVVDQNRHVVDCALCFATRTELTTYTT